MRVCPKNTTMNKLIAPSYCTLEHSLGSSRPSSLLIVREIEDAGPTRIFPAWMIVDVRSGESREADDDDAGAGTAVCVPIALAICGVMIPVPPVLIKSRIPPIPCLSVSDSADAMAAPAAALLARGGDAPPALVGALGGDAIAPGMSPSALMSRNCWSSSRASRRLLWRDSCLRIL